MKGFTLIALLVAMHCCMTLTNAYFTGNSYTVSVYEDHDCQKEFKTLVLPNFSPKDVTEDLEQVCVTDGNSFVRSGGSCDQLAGISAGAGFVVWNSPQCIFMPNFRFFAMIEDGDAVYGQCLQAKFASGRNPEMVISARILSCNEKTDTEADSDSLTVMTTDDILASFTELNKRLGGPTSAPMPSFPFSLPSNSQPGNSVPSVPSSGEDASNVNPMDAFAQMILDAMNAAMTKAMSQDHNQQ